MRAIDVMTTNVITAAPDTSVQELAALLSNHGISGVPVVDTRQSIGRHCERRRSSTPR